MSVAPFARGISDVARPGLSVLFCGINPGTVSGTTGHHFARPGNRFWKVLYGAGFTDRLLAPAEQEALLDFDIGVTNLVSRVSAVASELTKEELIAGGAVFEEKVGVLAPRFVAVLGVQAYRMAFRHPKAAIGEQAESLGGARVWLLPNPSGLQARYQLPEMIELFGELRVAAGLPRRSPEPVDS